MATVTGNPASNRSGSSRSAVTGDHQRATAAQRHRRHPTPTRRSRTTRTATPRHPDAHPSPARHRDQVHQRPVGDRHTLRTTRSTPTCKSHTPTPPAPHPADRLHTAPPAIRQPQPHVRDPTPPSAPLSATMNSTRSAGSCGSIGRYAAAGLPHPQDRDHHLHTTRQTQPDHRLRHRHPGPADTPPTDSTRASNSRIRQRHPVTRPPRPRPAPRHPPREQLHNRAIRHRRRPCRSSLQHQLTLDRHRAHPHHAAGTSGAPPSPAPAPAPTSPRAAPPSPDRTDPPPRHRPAQTRPAGPARRTPPRR